MMFSSRNFNKTVFHPEFNIRKSQLLMPFGSASLIDINNQSIMICDSENWDKEGCEIIQDIRLEKLLKCNGFIEPPILEGKNQIEGVRFPKWYFSPKTRKLKNIFQWEELDKKYNKGKIADRFHYKPYDPEKDSRKAELVPVRLVCACRDGHLQDFPWLEWAHKGMDIKNYENHSLKLTSQGNTGSISEMKVICETCEKNNNSYRGVSLAGIFDKEKFSSILSELNVPCSGLHLWNSSSEENKCKEPLQVLLKNATNLYFPNIITSVNIPFEENNLIELIQSRTNDYNMLIQNFETLKEDGDTTEEILTQKVIIKGIKKIADAINVDVNKVTKELFKKLENSIMEDEFDDVMSFRRSEYEVLTNVRKFDNNSKRLKVTFIDDLSSQDHIYSNLIEEITLVHQIDIVKVLTSFSRIDSRDNDQYLELENSDEKDEKRITNVSLRRKDNYFVGTNMKGEGIFFTIDKSKIKDWKKRIEKVPASLNIYKKGERTREDVATNYFTPEYYMLHTLSHIMIKELSNSSGYSSSSLSERIYFSNEEGKEMYGILIYTSSSDAEGTLGGLVKQGLPNRFFSVLNDAIEKSKWCSFDPICNESDNQGKDSLNAAACHACALISETSCENRNLYLDRRMLIGTIEDSSIGFFYNERDNQ